MYAKLRSYIPSISGLLVAIAVWQLVVMVFKLHPVTLPSPYRVLRAGWEVRVDLAQGFLATGAAAILGLTCSVILGFVLGAIFSQAAWLRRALYPYVVFLQTVPIVAIAPLLITWFGYGFKTVVLVAAIISLFPIVSNVTTGLISVDENLLDLFKLHRSSRWQQLWKLRIPHAVSHLVLGMRVSAGLAVIGAIVGEFFVGTNAAGFSGLGTLMTGWQNLAKTDAIMAAIVVSTALGLLTLGTVNFLEFFCLRKWTRNTGFENDHAS